MTQGDLEAQTGDAANLYARAAAAGDADWLMEAYAPDAVLRSPISGSLVFRGAADLHTLMSEVYRVARDVEVTSCLTSGRTAVVALRSRTWGVRTEEVFVLRLNDHGKIESNTVHVRPWFGLTVFAIALGPRLLRHPGVLRRAATRPSSRPSSD